MDYKGFQLQKMRIHALYVLDANDRLLRVNETNTKQVTPRFYFARTRQANHWWMRYDVPQAIAEKLEYLASQEPVLDDLDKPLQYHDKYIELLGEDVSVTKIHQGPAYYLPEYESSEDTISIASSNKHLLESNFLGTVTMLDERNPIMVISVNDVAIAMCFCARKTKHVAEAGVHTMEAYRKQGYALRVVRDWSMAIRRQGIMPLYSTSQDNLASQAVANKLKAVRYATDFSFT